jgi:hypothetical protein
MHGPATRTAALALVAAGVNDCEIARRLGLPRTTVRDWRRPTYTRVVGPHGVDTCARCWQPMTPVCLPADDYAELLGLYLGDGCICRVHRIYRLRISLDVRHPGVVTDSAALLSRCFPGNRVGRVAADRGSTVVLSLYHRHLPCLFPQHGPGKKHERRIRLEPWQQEIVDASPRAYLRGCIRSDGCVFINRTGRYQYLSYDFANHSTDILDSFEATCRALGLRARRYARHIRLYRRADVALLVDHVGMKQ